MKATQLEQMKLDYIAIKSAKQLMEEKMQQNGEVGTRPVLTRQPILPPPGPLASV